MFFHPEETTDLIVELSTLGHTLSWDLVMDLTDDPTIDPADIRVEPLEAGEELWTRVEDSLALFGNDATVSEQLRRIEEETFSAEHKRWLGVRDDGGTIVALAALVLLEGVGYLDNVATFPEARGRGMASAIVARAIELARGVGGGAREPVRRPRRARGRADVRAARLPGGGPARVDEGRRDGCSRRASPEPAWNYDEDFICSSSRRGPTVTHREGSSDTRTQGVAWIVRA